MVVIFRVMPSVVDLTDKPTFVCWFWRHHWPLCVWSYYAMSLSFEQGVLFCVRSCFTKSSEICIFSCSFFCWLAHFCTNVASFCQGHTVGREVRFAAASITVHRALSVQNIRTADTTRVLCVTSQKLYISNKRKEKNNSWHESLLCSLEPIESWNSFQLRIDEKKLGTSFTSYMWISRQRVLSFWLNLIKSLGRHAS